MPFTALALLYCGAAAALATGLVLGAIIGPHWCHMLVKAVLPTLGDNTAVVTVSNIFGIGIGAAVGAAASLLLGGFLRRHPHPLFARIPMHRSAVALRSCEAGFQVAERPSGERQVAGDHQGRL